MERNPFRVVWVKRDSSFLAEIVGQSLVFRRRRSSGDA